jgi:hypothetical protein
MRAAPEKEGRSAGTKPACSRPTGPTHVDTTYTTRGQNCTGGHGHSPQQLDRDFFVVCVDIIAFATHGACQQVTVPRIPTETLRSTTATDPSTYEPQQRRTAQTLDHAGAHGAARTPGGASSHRAAGATQCARGPPGTVHATVGRWRIAHVSGTRRLAPLPTGAAHRARKLPTASRSGDMMTATRPS